MKIISRVIAWLEGLSGKGKFFSYASEMLDIYNTQRVPRSAAALSYCLTLSIFPTLICIYTILVNAAPGLDLTIEDFQGVIPESAVTVIMSFLNYVSEHNDRTMITAGIIGMITTSAATFRTIDTVMADIQGESRFKGLVKLISSFVFSLFFLLSIYFAAIVMVSGNWIMMHLENAIPVLSTISLWQMLKYPILFVVFVLILYGLYRITAPKGTKESVLPGAVLAAVLLVLVSYFFSIFINMSTKYPIIYGSLASIIIVMLWLYACAIILIMCNALNYLLRKHAAQKQEQLTEKYFPKKDKK